MEEIQFIVARLADKPFNLTIRAVDFDEKSPDEHLQILNDVVASLSVEIKADVRTAPRDDIVEQLLQFLLLHKCDRVPSAGEGLDEWIDCLRDGRKDAVYQILHWVLSEYEHLEKRTYLSQYLMPVDVPSEYVLQGGGHLEELLDAYKELQAEFIEVHKHYESMKAKVDRPTSELIDGIKKMEEEEQQLIDRLRAKQVQANKNPSFQHVLAESSEMRKAQDNEIRLEEQKQEQLQSLAATKRRLHQARRLLDVTATCEDQPAESVLGVLERECKKTVDHLESNVVQRRHGVELMLLQAEKEAHLDKTEEDLERIVETVAQLEDMLNRKREELADLGNRHGSCVRLADRRQEVLAAGVKLHVMQKDVDAQLMEKELLKSTNNELRFAINSLEGNEIRRPDGTSMSRQELSDFREDLKRQLDEKDRKEKDCAAIRKDISELRRTKDALKIQHRSTQEQLLSSEERLGVAGYREVNGQLEQTSKETTSLNTKKTQTLDEISAMVQEIASTLDGKKHKLEPQIEELKLRRKEFQELQENHSAEKVRYDEAASKLSKENKEVEDECDRLQKEWLEKERRCHLLLAKDEIEETKLGSLPSLGKFKKSYEGEIVRQQDLARELRAREPQGAVRTEEYSSRQKAHFTNAGALLVVIHNEL